MESFPTTRVSALFGRLFWMMIGPLALIVTLYSIVVSGTGWTTIADLLYFLFLGGLILGRWLEFRGGAPTTAAGEPAVPSDLRRYIYRVLFIGPLLWVVANLLGNHVFLS